MYIQIWVGSVLLNFSRIKCGNNQITFGWIMIVYRWSEPILTENRCSAVSPVWRQTNYGVVWLEDIQITTSTNQSTFVVIPDNRPRSGWLTVLLRRWKPISHNQELLNIRCRWTPSELDAKPHKSTYDIKKVHHRSTVNLWCHSNGGFIF